MERPSYSRQDTDAVIVDEKQPYGMTTATDNSSGELSKSKDSIAKGQEAGSILEAPAYDRDAEAAFGQGDVKNLETTEDIVTTVIHVDDDPTLNPWTFRMFFIGIAPCILWNCHSSTC
jgi:hypothetical protein